MRTSTGEHFSHHSVHLNVEFKLQEVFKHFFATRYLIPVLANSSFPLALKKKKKRQLDGSWYVHSACILLESRGWTLKMVSLVSHLDGWNFTYLKKKVLTYSQLASNHTEWCCASKKQVRLKWTTWADIYLVQPLTHFRERIFFPLKIFYFLSERSKIK